MKTQPTFWMMKKSTLIMMIAIALVAGAILDELYFYFIMLTAK